ncbi:glycosyltransferase family 2 protein [Carboxylicivirga taeanensis]|uniref:glycosyltransferase family 2 protein n=1 Tax=Carboxylicivirga taeanensis TaxID=1416875 RepID=UPI003F6DFFEC
MKVSFIVIGKNEESTIQRCLQSVIDTIKVNRLEAELLYVDSQSTDDSRNIAKRFCRVFLINGPCNAAIARNIGGREAKGQILVFLDGDMELMPDFMPHILTAEGGLKYPFVSGNFINYYYDTDGNFLSKDYYRKVYCATDTYQPTTGGLFAITKQLWDELGGMRPKFKRGQDLDLGYRLAQRGILLLRKKETMAIHHTVDYKFSARLWKDLISGAGMYARSVLYRSHWNNSYVLKRLLTSDPTLLLLIFSIVAALVMQSVWPLGLYLLATIAAVAYAMRKQMTLQFFERCVVQILRDVQMMCGLCLFFPSNKVSYVYEEL